MPDQKNEKQESLPLGYAPCLRNPLPMGGCGPHVQDESKSLMLIGHDHDGDVYMAPVRVCRLCGAIYVQV